jgi:hypothetical protein
LNCFLIQIFLGIFLWKIVAINWCLIQPYEITWSGFRHEQMGRSLGKN